MLNISFIHSEVDTHKNFMANLTTSPPPDCDRHWTVSADVHVSPVSSLRPRRLRVQYTPPFFFFFLVLAPPPPPPHPPAWFGSGWTWRCRRLTGEGYIAKLKLTTDWCGLRGDEVGERMPKVNSGENMELHSCLHEMLIKEIISC